MNIFVLDRDPVRAARMHCDTHVVKMVLETAQLLSTALVQLGEAKYDSASGEWRRIADAPLGSRRIYSPTHEEHPCAVWVRSAGGNYAWTRRLLEALLNEYQRRYGDESCKRHKTWTVFEVLRLLPRRLGDRPDAMTPFVQCVPDAFRREDPVEAYRAYYRADKSAIATWRKGDSPSWMN